MEAAALVLLAAGVGVNYGWQPMPDGSSRYEYVVQIEPEMLDALEENGSIPLVSDVPEHVRPIGRIRVVVGSGDLPRERLDKRLKPGDAVAGGSGGNPIELAQYNQYQGADGRYGQPQAATSDASSWNGGDSAPATAASGAGSAWNDAPISVAERTSDQGPMGRVGDSIDNATAPLRRGLEKVDDNLRNAVGNLGDRTRNLVDELGRPFQPRSNAADNRAPLGADGNNPNAPAWNGNAPTWNGSAATAAPADSPAPRYSEASNSWNGADAARLPEAPPFALPEQGATGSAADAATGSRSSSPGNVDWNGPAGSTSPQRIDQPIDPRDVGRWENASPESTQNRGGALGASDSDMQASAGRSSSGDVRTDAQAPRMGTGAAGNPAGFPAGPTSVGPRLPGFENDLASDKPEGARESARSSGAAGSPKIELDMLQQPATRPLEGTESAQAPASTVVGPAFPSPNAPGAASTAQTPNAPATGARAQGWDWARREGPRQPADAQPANNGGGRQTAAALFAWVLLTSSAAGNLYLFWSYQDVRHKYRALVRKTARAVGSRLSAA